MTLRDRVRTLVESSTFQGVVITLILLNAVILGMETSPRLMDAYGGLLRNTDTVILGLFVLELVLRVFAHRKRFFRDPWSWFEIGRAHV